MRRATANTYPSLSLLLAAFPFVLADPKFTVPAAGAVIPFGELNVAWVESNRPPLIEELTSFTLKLMVGGNEVNNMQPLLTIVNGGLFTAYTNHSASSIVIPELCGPVPNGFFLQMVSGDLNSGQLYDYSERFTITGLNGTVSPELLHAAAALNGNPKGPPRGGNVRALQSSSVASTTSSSAPNTNTVTVTSTPNTSGSSLPGSAQSPGPPSLSMGAIVGIVIAVLSGASIIIAFIVWTLLRRRRRRLRDGVVDVAESSDYSKPRPMWKQESVTTLSELSADGRVMEIGDGIPPPEMDSNAIRAELEGDSLQRPSPMREDSMGSSIWTRDGPNLLTPITPSVFEETLIGPLDFLATSPTTVNRI